MPLQSLAINDFRNLSNIKVTCGSDFNFLSGANGAGKSNFLEAVHYLGTGRSFRCSVLQRLVQHQAEKFILCGKIELGSNQAVLGIERSISEGQKLHIGGEKTNSIAEFARWLPLQTFNQESYQILTSGPRYRRQLIDWGVFHVEHAQLLLWQQTERALQQRNAALKQQQSRDQVSLWDREFVAAAYALHNSRELYLKKLVPLLRTCLAQLLDLAGLNIEYYAGWDMKRDLAEILQYSWTRDSYLGFTQFGPHRADLQLKIGQVPVQDVLSRGQQKLFLLALYVAQGLLLNQAVEKRSVFLIDDLLAELDMGKQQQAMHVLANFDAQIFITGIDLCELANTAQRINNKDIKMFHVEHGIIN